MSNAQAPIAKFFEEHKYAVIKSFIPPEQCAFLYNYCRMRANATRIMIESKWDGFSSSDGTYSDEQCPGTYTVYSDPAMDTLMLMGTPALEQIINVPLVPAFTHWRLYKNGDSLIPHTDRASSEIGVTLCLGYSSDTTQNSNEEYQWGLRFNDLKVNKEVEVKMSPGDMLVYRGCDLLHWREKFEGIDHAQVFMFFVDRNGPFAELAVHDTKPAYGLPPEYRNKEKYDQLNSISDEIEAEKLRNDPNWYLLK